MAGSSDDNRLLEELDTLVNTIQISEPRYKLLENIVEWGFAVSIGTMLGVISNYGKFKINDTTINNYVLIGILFTLGISSALLFYYKLILYLYYRTAVTRTSQAQAIRRLGERTGNEPRSRNFIIQKAHEIFTDERLLNLTKIALNEKREVIIMKIAAMTYYIGFISYLVYFAYALLTDP